MGVQAVDVQDGDPVIKSSGEHVGAVFVTFTDGRVVKKVVRASDADDWADKIANVGAVVQQSQAEADAEEIVENDDEILADYKEATRNQQALAYLRRAMQTGDPHRAYLKMSRFNDYRLLRGWNLNQVESALAGEGLTPEEWQDMRDRFQYLSNNARVTAMEAYQGVLAGDTWGEDYR